MDIHALAAALIDADRRASLARVFGEYEVAVHWENRCHEIETAMLRADTQPERAIVTERGVA